MFDHTGVIVQVAVEVDESRDPEVDIKVGRGLVAQGMPPWIARRRQRMAPLPPAEDAAERESFYAALWEDAPARIIEEVRQSHNVLGYSGH